MDRDFNRQESLLNPDELKNTTVTIIGAGATGSHIASILAQMGWGYQGNGKIQVFDFDTVEAHNLGNQAFHPEHIGMPKVDALQKLLGDRFGINIDAHNMKVTDQAQLVGTEYVLLLTDTMESRKEIFEKCFKYPFRTDLIIETRMGIEEGRVYAFDPKDPKQVEAWKATLYDDDKAEVSACGTSLSIGVTAHFLSALATTRIVQHFRQNKSEMEGNQDKDVKERKMWNEIHFSLFPESFYGKVFGEEEAKMFYA